MHKYSSKGQAEVQTIAVSKQLSTDATFKNDDIQIPGAD